MPFTPPMPQLRCFWLSCILLLIQLQRYAAGTGGEVGELFSVPLVSSPFNELLQLQICHEERVTDAVANLLLSRGIHSASFEPNAIEHHSLVDRVCSEVQKADVHSYKWIVDQCTEIHANVDVTTSAFYNDQNKYVTLYFQNRSVGGTIDEVIPVQVYLRQGYSAEQLAACVCRKYSCGAEEHTTIQSYLTDTLAAMKHRKS